MPTSSQALMLMNREQSQDSGRTTPRRTKSAPQRTLRPCPVSNIDINEMLTSHPDDVRENIMLDAFSDLENKPQTKMQSALTVHNYQTVLSYNPKSDSFSWKFLDDKSKKSEHSSQMDSDTENVEDIADEKTPENVESKTKTQRPETAELDTKKSVTFAKPLQYSCISKSDNLACFGLKIPMQVQGTESKPSVGETIQGKTWDPSSSQVARRSIVRIPSRDKSLPENRKERQVRTDNILQVLQREQEISADVTETNQTNASCRIVPATFMRERLPECKPLSVCFSLRNNERFSHLELKTLIEKQAGVCLTSLQYEPFTIKSGGIAIRSRWLACTRSVRDIQALLETGLQVDSDAIVVKATDEVMESEYKTFWNIIDVQNERRMAWDRTNMQYKKKGFLSI